MCRVCGKDKIKKGYPVSAYMAEIITAYKIDISLDVASVHPTQVCQSCRMMLYRFRREISDGLTSKVKLAPLFPFQEHTDNEPCNVCNKTKRTGRPPKRNGKTHIICDIGEESDTTDTASEAGSPSASHLPNNQPGPSSSSKSTSSKRKLDYADELEESSSTNTTIITSIDLDRINEKALGDILTCTICKGVPTLPVVTTCSHIYCRTCILAWLETASACPVCRTYLNEHDIGPLRGHLSVLFDALTVTCCNKLNGCSETLNLKNFNEHEKTCKFDKYSNLLKPKSNVVRGESLNKIPIYDCSRKYLKQKRLKEAFTSLTEFCSSHHEDETDVLFFMLRQKLYDKNDDRHHAIDSIWQGNSVKLTPNQCLAMRIDTLQSKQQYRSQYNFLKDKAQNPLQPPSSLDAVEMLHTPPSVRYSIEGFDYFDHYYHTPAKRRNENVAVYDSSQITFEPIDILDDFSENMPELATPNVKGVRWRYPDAIAKTLSDLEPMICKGLESNGYNMYDPSILLTTSIKDGADGMGDVSVHKSISDRYLPDKAFRFSFCVLKCELVTEAGEAIEIFCEERPNSVRTNRPLLECLCDENNHASSALCLLPIENEREFLKNKVLKVQTENGWRRHSLKFFNSMIDEKLDRNTNRYFFDKPLFVKARTSFESSQGFAVCIYMKYLSSGSLKTYFVCLSYLQVPEKWTRS